MDLSNINDIRFWNVTVSPPRHLIGPNAIDDNSNVHSTYTILNSNLQNDTTMRDRTVDIDYLATMMVFGDTANGNDLKQNGILQVDSEIGDYTPYQYRPETYIVPVLFAIIFVIGVLGNGTLVIIFVRHRAMRNIPNTYILSLALADLLVILICVPMAAIVYVVESWPWNVELCRISESLKDISIGVSVFTLTALAAERYCAIVNPLRKFQTRPLTVITASLIWVLAIVLATPTAIISEVIHQPLSDNRTLAYCTPFGQNGSFGTRAPYIVTIKATVYYVLPLSIIAILYALMARRLHISAHDMPGELGPQSRQQARARLHVARMVITFVIIFVICFLPYHTFNLWFHLYPDAHLLFNDFWNVLRIISFSLSFMNSCINPVALYCVSGVFRQHFAHYLCCRPLAPAPHRIGLSSGAGFADTSFMQSTVRRPQHPSSATTATVAVTMATNGDNGKRYHHRAGIVTSGVGVGGGGVMSTRKSSSGSGKCMNSGGAGVGANASGGGGSSIVDSITISSKDCIGGDSDRSLLSSANSRPAATNSNFKQNEVNERGFSVVIPCGSNGGGVTATATATGTATDIGHTLVDTR